MEILLIPFLVIFIVAIFTRGFGLVMFGLVRLIEKITGGAFSGSM